MERTKAGATDRDALLSQLNSARSHLSEHLAALADVRLPAGEQGASAADMAELLDTIRQLESRYMAELAHLEREVRLGGLEVRQPAACLPAVPRRATCVPST